MARRPFPLSPRAARAGAPTRDHDILEGGGGPAGQCTGVRGLRTRPCGHWCGNHGGPCREAAGPAGEALREGSRWPHRTWAKGLSKAARPLVAPRRAGRPGAPCDAASGAERAVSPPPGRWTRGCWARARCAHALAEGLTARFVPRLLRVPSAGNPRLAPRVTHYQAKPTQVTWLVTMGHQPSAPFSHERVATDVVHKRGSAEYSAPGAGGAGRRY